MTPLPVNIKIPEHLKPAGTPGSKLLEVERSNASFSVKDMSLYIHGKQHLGELCRSQSSRG